MSIAEMYFRHDGYNLNKDMGEARIRALLDAAEQTLKEAGYDRFEFLGTGGRVFAVKAGNPNVAQVAARICTSHINYFDTSIHTLPPTEIIDVPETPLCIEIQPLVEIGKSMGDTVAMLLYLAHEGRYAWSDAGPDNFGEFGSAYRIIDAERIDRRKREDVEDFTRQEILNIFSHDNLLRRHFKQNEPFVHERYVMVPSRNTEALSALGKMARKNELGFLSILDNDGLDTEFDMKGRKVAFVYDPNQKLSGAEIGRLLGLTPEPARPQRRPQQGRRRRNLTPEGEE